jgi:flavin-dependent dehydrogenase
MVSVIVMGGSLAGMAFSLQAARRGHQVTVLEHDHGPRPGPAGESLATWHRPGVPHFRQPHHYLARAVQVLQEDLPDVLAGVLEHGAQQDVLDGNDQACHLWVRRRVLEAELWRAAERTPAITLRCGVMARGFVRGPERRGVPTVAGVLTSSGDTVGADVVVDATGRRSRAPRWLAKLPTRPVTDQAHSCRFAYLTRDYRLRPGACFPTLQVPIATTLDYLTAIAFPADGGFFSLAFALSADDPHWPRLRVPEIFDRVQREIPMMAPWIDCGEPIDVPRPVGGIDNRWRRLVDDQGPVVAGLVLLGDAAMHTNPTWGRGISLAFWHGQHLAAILDNAAVDSCRFVAQAEAWAVGQLGTLYRMQVAADEARRRQIAAALRGERLPPSTDLVSRVAAAIAAMRDHDELVRAAANRVYNLLSTPQELMADRRVASRIIRFLKAHPVLEEPPCRPDRATFERLVSSS